MLAASIASHEFGATRRRRPTIRSMPAVVRRSASSPLVGVLGRARGGWGCPAGCWTERDPQTGQTYCYCPDYQRSLQGGPVYTLEPTQRHPAPLSGFADWTPAAKLLSLMGVAAAGLWVYSKVPKRRRALRGAHRRRRRRFRWPWQ